MCMTPIHLKTLVGEYCPVPCGKCPTCLSRRISGWAFRLQQEEKVCTSSHFLTLTYSTLHLPLLANSRNTLVKKDLQLFFKRLRKRNRNQLKYYAVGEYGGQTERAHYHMILFNAELKTIQPSWELGEINYGEVNEASIRYVLNYMEKKKPIADLFGRQAEFSLMSKGLGSNYLTNNMKNWHKSDLLERAYLPDKGGKKIHMPRYYKEKLYNELEREKIATHQMRSHLLDQDPTDLDPYFNRDKSERELAAFKRMSNSKKRKL
ncbi:MAG: replication initiator protein [Microviridae sp.]|nr:MAG: replication initiator protein [Microviridae sp.]